MRGFSLIEVLIVVVAISILASITFPRIEDLREGLALKGATDEFLAAHALARTVAIRSSRVGQLRLEPDSGTFWVQVDSSLAGNGVMDTIGAVVRLSELNVSLTSIRSVLCFDGRGIATSRGACNAIQSGAVTFTSGTESKSLWRTSLGLIPR